jgi:pimeloyl-ACP methyl ester carboxylesterase
MDRLAPRFHVLAADLYGYSQSPAWPDDRKLMLADEVRLLEPVFRSAGERFHLVGHSYGAAIALRAALDDPGRLRSLVLYEPVLFAALIQDDPESPAAREAASVRDDTIALVDRGELDPSGERFVDYWMGTGAWASTPEKRRAVLAGTMRKVKHEWHALFTEPTPLDAFKRLEVPTLFLVGAESPASTRRIAALLTARLPNLTVVELPGIGHMGPVTHPDRVNPEIEGYLDRAAGTPS